MRKATGRSRGASIVAFPGTSAPAAGPREYRFKRLEALREKAGLRIEILTDAAGHRRNWWYDIRSGKVRPYFDDMIAVAAALKVPLDDLVDLVDWRRAQVAQIDTGSPSPEGNGGKG